MLEEVLEKLKQEAEKGIKDNLSNAYGYIGLLKEYAEKDFKKDELLHAILSKEEKSLYNLSAFCAKKIMSEDHLKTMRSAHIYSPNETVWEMLKEYYLTDGLEVDKKKEKVQVKTPKSNQEQLSLSDEENIPYTSNLDKLIKDKETKIEKEIKDASIEKLSANKNGQMSLFGL